MSPQNLNWGPLCEPQFRKMLTYAPLDPASDPKVRNCARKVTSSVRLPKAEDMFAPVEAFRGRTLDLHPVGHSFFLHDQPNIATATAKCRSRTRGIQLSTQCPPAPKFGSTHESMSGETAVKKTGSACCGPQSCLGGGHWAVNRSFGMFLRFTKYSSGGQGWFDQLLCVSSAGRRTISSRRG